MDEEITVDEAYLVSLRDALISDVEKIFTIFDSYNEFRLKINKRKLDDVFLKIQRTEFQDWDVLKHNKPLNFGDLREELKALHSELETYLKQSNEVDIIVSEQFFYANEIHHNLKKYRKTIELVIHNLSSIKDLTTALEDRSKEFSKACKQFQIDNPRLLDKEYFESLKETFYITESLLYDAKPKIWYFRYRYEDEEFQTYLGHLDNINFDQALKLSKFLVTSLKELDETGCKKWDSRAEIRTAMDGLITDPTGYIEKTTKKLNELKENLEEIFKA